VLRQGQGHHSHGEWHMGLDSERGTGGLVVSKGERPILEALDLTTKRAEEHHH